MSRLDSFIRRLEAQRACLNLVASMIERLDGPVIELGLGNGRTYDHLCELLSPREIFVFERSPDPHPLSKPDKNHLIIGDIATTLPQALSYVKRPIVLAHSDIGTGDPQRNARVAAMISNILPQILADGAMVASDQELHSAALGQIELPSGVEVDRYFIYRHINGQ